MIDTHQHFWRLSRGGYAWMPEDLPALNRDYEPKDLRDILNDTGITGTIAVQADDSVAETEFLLSLSDAHPWILGVVGWVDLERADATRILTALAEHPKFLGIRPMIQDISDPEWMLRPTLAAGLNRLVELDLTFDALVLPHHLKTLARFMERYPDLRVVVDHCAKPNLRSGVLDEWRDGLAAVAAHPNSFCKLSGLLTEAPPGAGLAELRDCLDHVSQLFGPNRLLFGSDWPVLNLATDYAKWQRIICQYIDETPGIAQDTIGQLNPRFAYTRLSQHWTNPNDAGA
ncbi:amidohydrolase family protein [Tritonibacter mobilis]|uniref:amidohydrolase family protein n=1 Tax=Tritonibacter mobilis TaxID=379347 RepID=UPI003A5C1861